jgi:hypothetical protein
MAATSSSTDPVVDPAVDEKKVKIEFRREAFDKEFRLLIKQAQETVQARYGLSLELGEVRTELICLNRYLSLYNNMTPPEHFQYFENIYNRHRTQILNTLASDIWLRNGRIAIQFGDGVREVMERSKLIRIPLSEVFLIACELQATAEKAMDGIDEKFISGAADKDLIRPNILLLHLMRIFYHLNDGADKEPLGVIVTHIENELGVQKKTVGSEPWKVQAVPPINPQSAQGGLSSLFDMATGMMSKMGFQPPPGIKRPTEQEMGNVISSVFQSETTQNAMQGIFTSLQGCNDFGTAIRTVVQNVTDPTTMSAIQESVTQTAQFAAEGPKGPQ